MLNLTSFKSLSLMFLAFIFSAIYFYSLSINVGGSEFYAFFGVVVLQMILVFSFFKFGALINPISLLLPFMLGFYYYGFGLSTKQDTLSLITIAAVVCFIFFYILGCLLNLRNFDFLKITSDYTNFNLNGVYFVYFMGLVVFFLECLMNRGLPLYSLLVLKEDVYSELKLIPMLHYFVMLHALIPAILYYAKRKRIISNMTFLILSLGSFFVLFNNLSRQIIILCVICFFFAYVSANKIRTDSILFKGLLTFGVIFFGLGQLRVAAINDEISATDYLKIYSEVPEHYNVNLFDVTFNLYAALNFNTLNDIVESTDSVQGHGYGKYMFKPILSIVKADDVFQFEYGQRQDSFERLGTIVADPYLDFGVLGVSLLSFLYGIFSTQIYKAFSSSHDLGVTLVWSVNVFVMVMSVFTNFYNILFIWACIFFGFYLSGYLSLKKLRLN